MKEGREITLGNEIQAPVLLISRIQQNLPAQDPGQSSLVIAAAGVLGLVLLIALLLRRRQAVREPGPGGVPCASQPVELNPRAETSGWLLLADGTRFALTAFPIAIGSDGANQVVLQHPTIAPLHARVYMDDLENVLCIEDPTGGSLLMINRRPTRRSLLKDNDEIILGELVMRFQFARPSAAAQPGA